MLACQLLIKADHYLYDTVSMKLGFKESLAMLHALDSEHIAFASCFLAYCLIILTSEFQNYVERYG